MRQPDNRPGLTAKTTSERDWGESVPSDGRPSTWCNAGRVDAAAIHAGSPARVAMTASVPLLVVVVPKSTLIRSHLAWYEDERPVHRREDVSRAQVRDEDADGLVSA